MKRTLLISLLTLSLSTAPALAASPSATGYDETGAAEVLDTTGPAVLGASAVQPVSTQSNGSGTTPDTAVAVPTETREVAAGSLPFTGLEVGVVLLAAIALLGAGFALRRTTRLQS